MKIRHKIEIFVTEEGQFKLLAPLDYPCLCLQMLETARQAVIAEGAQREQQGMIEIADAASIPAVNGARFSS
jgi:hypothetical protein